VNIVGTGWTGLLRRHALLGAAALLLVAAVWMPPVVRARVVSSYIVTFDITQSMDTEDVALNGRPVSRLTFAKTAMQQALARLPCGSRVGWSVFTGTRSLLLFVPVEACAHYDALLSSLDEIGGHMLWADSSVIAAFTPPCMRRRSRAQERRSSLSPTARKRRRCRRPTRPSTVLRKGRRTDGLSVSAAIRPRLFRARTRKGCAPDTGARMK
jgi:hypothetical protein